MNKIRVIDLLNKIANGEEVPKEIKYRGILYKYCYSDKDYYGGKSEEYYNDALLLPHVNETKEFLNDEVEIIEDTLKHFGKEENQAVRNIIKKNSIPVKENYNDYYEDTPENKRIEKFYFSVYQMERLGGYNVITPLETKINEIIDKINVED